MMSKIVYVDMDGVLVDFESGIDSLTEQELKSYENRLDEVPGIFSRMKPIEGAIESFQKLTNHYNVFILSTAPWENPTALNDKLMWIKNHIGELAKKRVIFSHNKHLNMGDYLIDDRTANGAGDFKGTHIHFGTERFPNWEAVLQFLKVG
jgi:5'(3')-deoxyribonucleotidase